MFFLYAWVERSNQICHSSTKSVRLRFILCRKLLNWMQCWSQKYMKTPRLSNVISSTFCKYMLKYHCEWYYYVSVIHGFKIFALKSQGIENKFMLSLRVKGFVRISNYSIGKTKSCSRIHLIKNHMKWYSETPIKILRTIPTKSWSICVFRLSIFVT